MMPLRLSLCVPTYAHAPLLAQSLRAILSQLTPEFNPYAEVVILDNASPDETPDVVAALQAEFPDAAVRCLRRSENVGPDANFCDAVNQAHGEFVLLLSDDDILLPGAVAALLAILKAHPDLDAVTLNTRPFRVSPDEDTAGIYRITEDRWLEGRDQALVFLQMHITFLSCIAFRRANVLNHDYSVRYVTNLAQSYLFLDALLPGRGLYAACEPFLAQRVECNSGYSFFRVFVTNLHALILHAETLGYSAKTVQTLKRRHFRFLIYALCVFKSKGTLGTLRPDYQDCLTRLWQAYGPSPLLVPVALLILTPRSVFVLLFNRLYTAFRKVRARSRASGQPV